MKSAFRSVIGGLHHLAFGLRFALRSARWTPAQPRARPSAKTVLVSGFFNEALGVGRAGHLVASGLERAGYDVFREDLRPFDHGLLTQRAVRFSVGAEAPIWLVVANPPEARIALFAHDRDEWKHRYRIGLWHWESSVAPAEWVSAALWFHEIWLSSRFTADAIATAMRKAGRPEQVAKLRVHPLPVNIPSEPRLRSEHDGVEVLAMFDPRSDFERKNPLAVLQVWLSLFPEESRTARLTLKTLSAARGHPRFIALEQLAKNRRDIVLMAETLPAEDTETLIAASDILISLHRGEGFGLPLAEAMARCVCVMATGWSGNRQYMTEENAILIPFTLVPAAKNYNGPTAQWAEPDIDAAASALARLIEDPKLRNRLSARARDDIARMSAGWLSPM